MSLVEFARELIYKITGPNLDGALATVFVLVMAVVSAVFYSHKGRWYAENKRGRMKSIASFRFVYRYVQVSTIVASIGSFLTNHAVFFELHDEAFLIYLGISISTVAMALFISAKLTLGEHYSPCFDSYIPRDIVQEGLYRYIRHPIYVSNLILVLGVFVASGSSWVLFNLAVLGVYYVYSALNEESVLLETFPIYEEYSKQTSRFFPNRKAVRDD